MTTTAQYPHDRVRKIFAFNAAMTAACPYYDHGDTNNGVTFIVSFNRPVTPAEVEAFDDLYDNYSDPAVHLIDYQRINRIMYTEAVSAQTMTPVQTLVLFKMTDDIYAESAKLWLEMSADVNVSDPEVTVRMYDAVTDLPISDPIQADATQKFAVVQLTGLKDAYPLVADDAHWYLKMCTSDPAVVARIYHLQWRYVSEEIPQPLPTD